MAINKKLISFATQAQFAAQLSAGNIDNRSIVFIEDEKRIWTHGVYFDTSWNYLGNKPSTFTPSAHTLGSHSDVTLASLANGNILRYNGSRWVNNTLAQAGIATPADISTAIAGLEIGGRNLLVGSKDEIKSPSGEMRILILNGGVPEGTYTLSFNYLVHSGNPTGFLLYTDTSLTLASKVGNKVNHTFTVNATHANKHIYMYSGNGAAEGRDSDVTYYNLKLTGGNKSLVDWSPALEDQVSDWVESDLSSFSYIKNKPTRLKQFENDLGNYGSWITKAQGDGYYAPKSHTHSYLPLTGGRITTGTGDVNLEFWRGTNASWNILNSGGYLRFQSNYTNTVGAYYDVLKLDYNTGNALFKGNVTAPTFIGNVTGNVSGSAGSTTNWAGNTYANSNITNEVYLMTSTNGTGWRRTLASRYVDTTSAQSIGGVKSFTGNVGIGTTNPLQKLSVTNTFAITNTSGNQYLLMGNQDSGGANKPAVIHSANSNLNFGYGSSWSGSGGIITSVLSISGNNVGIGTTSPSEKLEVSGNIKATSFLGKATSAGDADTVGGLAVNPAANTSANRLVRTNASGYIQSAYINTTSGEASGTLNRVYVSQDSYLRYLTPASFISSLGLATTSYVDNIEIGGRNLIKNSKTTAFPPTYSIGGTTTIVEDITISTGWKWRRSNFSITGGSPSLYFNTYSSHYYTENFAGEKVTISFWMRGDVPFTYDGQSIGTEWTKYSRTRIWHSSANWHPIFGSAATLNWYEMHSLKIEKGSIATDWTLAPEDQVSDWSTTDATSFSFIKNKPTTFATLGLTDSLGSATQPVYFSGGKPVATTYSLGKSVPSNAVFTDTNTFVTQNVTTVSEYKPFLLGYNTATISGNFANITSSSFYANTLRVQPSTGNIITSGTVTASKMFKSSDRSLKEKIGKINLSNIDKINLIEFNWKSDNKKDYGVIAQDLEVYYPELVNTDDNGMKTVNYESLYAVKIARLEERIKELEGKLWKN